MRLTASISRDLFERDYDCSDADGYHSPQEMRRVREHLIIQLLRHGYDVTLTTPTGFPPTFGAVVQLGRGTV